MKLKETGTQGAFGYAKAHFYTRAVLYGVLVAMSAALFRNPTEDMFPWYVSLVILLFALLLVFGISPLFTSHRLTRSRLMLRQGLFFRSVVPLMDIESAKVYDGEVRIGLALSLRSSILFVTSSKHNLVEIRLKRPKRFPQLLGFSANRIVLNVDKRDELLAALSERLTSLAPVKSDSPDA